MKNGYGFVLSVIAVIMGSNAAQAAGYRCQAQCVAVDSYQNRLFLFDTQMITEADARKVQVFEHLKAKCEAKARDYGVYAPAVLVKELDFAQSSSSSSTYSGHHSHGGYWSGWYGYYSYYPYYGYRGYHSDSYSGTSNTSGEMKVRYSPATIASSCERDREIAEGTLLEWLGDLPMMD